MNERQHRSSIRQHRSIGEVIVVAAAIGALALALSGGLTADQRGSAATVAVASATDGSGRAAPLAGRGSDPATGAPASAAWWARYEALKDRQLATLEAGGGHPCRTNLTARERYEAFKLHQGDEGAARTPVQGCR